MNADSEVVHLGRDRPADVAEGQELEGEVLRCARSSRRIGPVTLSLGLATFPDQGADGASLVRLADAALYRAKREGRDRLIVHDATVAA